MIPVSLGELDGSWLAKQLRAGRTFKALVPPGSAPAWLAWSLAALANRPIVWVVDGPRSLDRFHRDLLALAPRRADDIAYYPAWEALPGAEVSGGWPPPADLTGDRLAALQTLHAGPQPAIVVTCIQALMQRAVNPAAVAAAAWELAAGASPGMEALREHLQREGYAFEPEVHAKGEAAHRGGIVDLWPASSDWPLRVEFFGDTIESLRAFDPATQASQHALERIRLAPATEPLAALTASLHDHLPGGALWVWHEAERILHHGTLYADTATAADAAFTLSLEEARVRCERPGSQVLELGLTEERPGALHAFAFGAFEGTPDLRTRGLQPDLVDSLRRETIAQLNTRAADGWQLHLFFATPGSRERFEENLGPHLAPRSAYTLHTGALSEGFICPPLRLLAASEEDLYGRRREARSRYDLHAKRAGPRQREGTRIDTWTDLQPGDFVVHVDHGIGKYLGLFEIEVVGQRQEVLSIEYADKAKLHLPAAQAHLLSRYTGLGKGRPELHALGGRRWDREKEAATKAVQDLAAQLLQTQASRDALPGHAFAADTPWQHEFEASFPYQETPDQETAIESVRRDMEQTRPMDRLVCGDVGYGKTEVAMRAAFKCVMDGKQVAMVVPTTILAQQHFDPFAARMGAWPVRLAMLTRFQTRGEQNVVVARANAGELDIVIGTHRLLQGDLRFHDLGLVIVDEEQRFGVLHKEHFKHAHRMVDMLTLTATPIPRTLYMSLTGAKDLSTIETPPLERLPVETVVAPRKDHVVRDAILRELNREGQVYFLHNRVKSIEREREKLQELVPEARIATAHGQMPEDELAAIMRAFVRAEFDVLLCTTIIESGLDIANVNTILIDRADRFGLAELYQLRGRVGRYKRRAYAYLLLPEHGQLFDAARKRITAIRHHSQLGAGFRLAMRDLEIRGAGNLLGAQQSGHISAVGFDLYCQLLRRTVAALKGEPLPPVIDCDLRLDFLDLSPQAADTHAAAAIPAGFIEDENHRLRLYREIATASSAAEVQAVERGAADRFGRLPAPMKRLFAVARLRIAASTRGIRKIEVEEGKVMMTRAGDFIMPGGRFPRLKAARPGDKLEELLNLVKSAKA